MNRRDALKTMLSAAGSALVPSWLIPDARPSHGLDLTPFCAPEWWPRQYRMDLPFVQNGVVDDPNGVVRAHFELFRYATNGHVCVRVPIHPGAVIDREEIKLPPVLNLPWTHDWPYKGKWLAWPRANYLLACDSDCMACDGTGNQSGEPGLECDECGGFGWVIVGEYETSQVKCRGCHGRGVLLSPDDEPCHACKGNAIGVFPTIQRLATGYVCAGYHAKLATLPDVEYFVPDRAAKGDAPIKVRFHGGQGLLMPMDGKAVERRLQT